MTALTLAPALYFVLASGRGAWTRFWTLFGASNQLLAALTLLVLTLWLRRQGKSALFTLLPMLFVAAITLWALGVLAFGNLRAAHGIDVAFWNGAASVALLALAGYLMYAAFRSAGGGPSRGISSNV